MFKNIIAMEIHASLNHPAVSTERRGAEVLTDSWGPRPSDGHVYRLNDQPISRTEAAQWLFQTKEAPPAPAK